MSSRQQMEEKCTLGKEQYRRHQKCNKYGEFHKENSSVTTTRTIKRCFITISNTWGPIITAPSTCVILMWGTCSVGLCINHISFLCGAIAIDLQKPNLQTKISFRLTSAVLYFSTFSHFFHVGRRLTCVKIYKSFLAKNNKNKVKGLHIIEVLPLHSL